MTRRLANGVARLDLQGPLTADAASDTTLRTGVAELTTAGVAEIAVNLAGVTRVDAYGLGQLVLAWLAARTRGGRVTYVAAPPRLRHLLSLTRLDTVFDLRAGESAAAFSDQDCRRISCAIVASSTRIFSSSA